MKAVRASLLAGVGAILATSVAWAAGPAPQPAQPGPHCGPGGRASQSLGLTDAQKAKIQPILEKYRGQFQTLREQQRTKRDELRQRMQAEISPILTPEQREKAQEMREQRATRQSRGFGPQAWRFGPGARRFGPQARSFGPQARRFGPQDRRSALRPGHGQAMGPRLSQQLQLTPDQQKQLTEIAEARRTAMQSLLDDARSGKLDRGQVRERAQALRKEAKANVSAILTPEQQQKLQDLRQQYRGPWRRG